MTDVIEVIITIIAIVGALLFILVGGVFLFLFLFLKGLNKLFGGKE